MNRFIRTFVLSATLLAPVAMMAQDHTWNKQEDKAYRRYQDEKHIKHHKYTSAKKEEQDDYWKWRQDHPDHH